MKSTANLWKNSISRLYHMAHIKVLQQILRLQLPDDCQLEYSDMMDDIGKFILTIKPKEGFWKNGTFKFSIAVPENYGYQSPTVTCLTKIWHPSIDEDGKVVLQLEEPTGRIYQSGPNGMGKIIEIIWEIYALFTVYNLPMQQNNSGPKVLRI